MNQTHRRLSADTTVPGTAHQSGQTPSRRQTNWGSICGLPTMAFLGGRKIASPYVLVVCAALASVVMLYLGSRSLGLSQRISSSATNKNTPPNYISASSNRMPRDTTSELGRATNATLGVRDRCPSPSPNESPSILALIANPLLSSLRKLSSYHFQRDTIKGT